SIQQNFTAAESVTQPAKIRCGKKARQRVDGEQPSHMSGRCIKFSNDFRYDRNNHAETEVDQELNNHDYGYHSLHFMHFLKSLFLLSDFIFCFLDLIFYVYKLLF